MSTSTKSEIKRTDFLKLGTTTGEITKVISPNDFQVGLDDPDFNSSLIVKGGLKVNTGITGSITQVSEGVDLLQAGNNISITKNADGSMSIGATGFPTNSALSFGSGLTAPFTYNGSGPVTVAAAAKTQGGLAVQASGITVDHLNVAAASPDLQDRIMIGDATSNTFDVKTTTIQSILQLGSPATISHAITFGDGIKDSNGQAASWNNSVPATLAIDLTTSDSGLNFSGGKLFVDPSQATATTVIDTANDFALIYDNSSGATRKVALQYIAGTAPNGLTIGNGLAPNGVAYDGSVARTISVLTDATLQAAASGLSVLKVPNVLTDGNGIQNFSYDGSSAVSIQVDLNSTGGLGINSVGSDLQLDINSLSAGAGPAATDEVAVSYGNNDTKKIPIGAISQLTLLGRESGAVWVDGGTKAHTTSSISIDSGGQFADAKGQDNFFYVSGTIGNNTNTAKKSVFGGDVFVSGSLSALTGLSGSLTRLANGNPYLLAGTNVTLSTSSAGSITISATGGGGGGGSSTFQSGSTSVGAVTTVDTTQLGKIQNLGGGTIAITGSIGFPEDGSYEDGLFTDFVSTTAIGVAIDRFNEVLKGLAPGAAPNLDDVACSTNGDAGKLSFGTTQAITGYTNVQPSTLSPASSLSDVDINGSYTNTSSGNNLRKACFDGSTTITGILNDDVTADGSNYGDNSFGSANQGTLKLFVNNNSTEIHSVDLSSFGSGNSVNGNGSGFTGLSAQQPGHFADGTEFSTFIHRSGSYSIAPSDQRQGWNYARVVHTINSVDTTTNYVEWVNDSDSNALASAGSVLDSLTMTGDRRLSGVKYHTGGTAQYRVRVMNAYRNVYPTSNITFSTTRCSVPAQSFPAIDHASGENELKVLHITGSVTINADPMLNNDFAVGVTVPAVLKAGLGNSGAQTIGGIFLYNLSNTSTSTQETFRAENYRLISGSYDAQSDVTDSNNAWDSSKHMSGSNTGHQDGLLFYNSRMYAPRQGLFSGDFRNTADGGSIANGPAGNTNYSGINSGMRTFYRYLQNTSGGSKSNFSIAINGSGTIVPQATALNTTNIHVLLKIPETSAPFSTGWMDLALPFATGQNGNGAGCLDGSLDSSLNATNNGTFGTQSVGANEYIVVKIEADATWTGNISQLSITWT